MSVFFTVAHKSDTATPDQRRLALVRYLEGLGFRSIGRILGFSHVAVMGEIFWGKPEVNQASIR